MSEHRANTADLQEKNVASGQDHGQNAAGGSFADTRKFCRYGGSEKPAVSEQSNVVEFPNAGHHGASGNTSNSSGNSLSHGKTATASTAGKNKGGRPRKYQHKLTEKAAENIYRRCLDPAHPSYQHYGPTYLCDRWRYASDPKYMIYLDLLDTPGLGRRPSKDHSPDRIDPRGLYSPDNLRWATPKQQAQNRRTPAHTKRMIDQMGEAWVEACWRYQGYRAKLPSHAERSMLATIAHNVQEQGIAVFASDPDFHHMAYDPVCAMWLVAAVWGDFSVQHAMRHHPYVQTLDGETGQKPHYIRNLIAKSPEYPELTYLYRHIEVLLNYNEWEEVADLWDRGECEVWTAHQPADPHQGGAGIDPDDLEHML